MSNQQVLAIPARTPRLMEAKRPKAPLYVREAPAPVGHRALPQVAWRAVGDAWEEASIDSPALPLWSTASQRRVRTSEARRVFSTETPSVPESFTLTIPLGLRTSANPGAELSEAGAGR
jgi:hypothetical protein